MNKLELDIGSPEWLDNSDLKNIMSVLNGGGDHALDFHSDLKTLMILDGTVS